MGKIISVALGLVRPNPVALRQVDQKSPAFMGLVESIRIGFKGAISVRQKKDDAGAVYYELIDGLHRYTAAIAVGMETIPVDICDESDEQVLCTQIMMNVHKVDTKPQEYGRQLQRMLDLNPTLTVAELAKRLGHTAQWIEDRLSLDGIANPEIRKAIDEGKICVANAVGLSRLPDAEQATFLDRAMTQKADEFLPAVKARVKEIRAARQQGKEAGATQFVPVARMRKPSEIRDEAKIKLAAEALIANCKLKTPFEAFVMAIKWVDHMDPLTVAQEKTDFETREAAAKLAREKKESERAAAKAEKTTKAADEAQKAAAEARAAAEKLAASRRPGATVTAAPL